MWSVCAPVCPSVHPSASSSCPSVRPSRPSVRPPVHPVRRSVCPVRPSIQVSLWRVCVVPKPSYRYHAAVLRLEYAAAQPSSPPTPTATTTAVSATRPRRPSLLELAACTRPLRAQTGELAGAFGVSSAASSERLLPSLSQPAVRSCMRVCVCARTRVCACVSSFVRACVRSLRFACACMFAASGRWCCWRAAIVSVDSFAGL